MSNERAFQKSWLVILTLCLVCTPVLAKIDPNTAGKRHTFEIGPEISWFKYVETGLMKDTGVLYGVSGSYIYRGPLFSSKVADSWMLRADGRYSAGRVDYDGALQDGTPYSIDNIDDYVWETRGLFGYDFKNDVARTTPYTGLGYRYLNDDTSSDPAGYERESNYLYLPLGMDILLASNSRWSLGGIVEWDILLWGEQISRDLNLGVDGFWTPKNRQRHGSGLKASVRLQGKSGFAVEPFVRYWAIGDSEIESRTLSDGSVLYGLEPKNRSVEWGVRIVFAF